MSDAAANLFWNDETCASHTMRVAQRRFQPCTLCHRDAQLHQRRAKWREQAAHAVSPRSAPDMLLTVNSDATSRHN